MKSLCKKFLVLFSIGAFSVQSQFDVHVNCSFQDSKGNPTPNPVLNQLGLQWSKNITTPQGRLITVGHTNVNGQGENIFLMEHDADGNFLFQTDFNTNGTQNDYGTSVALDASGNIYVCGTTDANGYGDYDVVVLIYNSGGLLFKIDGQSTYRKLIKCD